MGPLLANWFAERMASAFFLGMVIGVSLASAGWLAYIVLHGGL